MQLLRTYCTVLYMYMHMHMQVHAQDMRGMLNSGSPHAHHNSHLHVSGNFALTTKLVQVGGV